MTQEQMIRKLAGMLGDERTERRCAAAMVIAELRPKDKRVVEQLCACLAEPDGALQRYALEGLAALKAKKIAAFVTPLLDSDDEEVRARAVALLASQGAGAGAALAKELAGAPLPRQRAIVSIMARHHDQGTFDRLLRLFGDSELGDNVLGIMRAELDHMAPEARQMLSKKLTTLLKDKRWMSEPAVAGRTVRMVGYFRDAKLVKTLLPFTGNKHAVPVRLGAIAALRRPLSAARRADSAVQALFEHADDPDPTIARAAVETLRGLELDASAAPAAKKLSAGRHAEARRFAVELLGRHGDKKTLAVLIEHLMGEDPNLRDPAARALSKMEGAANVLVKQLEKAVDDKERLDRLRRLLRPHVGEFKPATRKALATLALQTLEADKITADSLVSLARLADPDGLAEQLKTRAQQHKRAKRHPQAFALLRRLDQADLLDEDGRYMALVSGLCSITSKKDLGRATRSTDPVLRQAVELVASGYSLASKLKRDKALAAEDLFFVGFNFAESRDEDEKEFGGELLGYLNKKSPRSKLGRSARNKLRLVGLE